MDTPISINGLQHTGIPVTDIKVSESFYRRLGFANAMQATFAGGEGTCIMMQRGSIVIELYQPPQAELVAIRQRQNGQIDHIAFDVSDIDAAFATATAQGFNVIEPEPVLLNFWQKGCKYFNITGPNGERLEFNQIL